MKTTERPFSEMFRKTYFSFANIKRTSITGFSEKYVQAALEKNWVPSDRRIQKLVAGFNDFAKKQGIGQSGIPQLAEWMRAAALQPHDRIPFTQLRSQGVKPKSHKNILPAADIEPQVHSSDDIENYAVAIQRNYAFLPFEIVEATGGEYRQLSLAKLYVPQKLKECQGYLSNILEGSTEHFRNLKVEAPWTHREHENDVTTVQRRFVHESPLSLTEVLSDENKQRIVLLGGVGAGKSSALRLHALNWAGSEPASRNKLPIPLLIELKLYTEYVAARKDSHDFIGFFNNATQAIWHFPREIIESRLNAGSAVLLLDGLDEVLNPTDREQIMTGLGRLSIQYPKCKIIITSRLSGFRAEPLKRTGFEHFLIQDFNDGQILEFIRKWQQETGVDPETGKGRTAAIKAAIDESKTLREFAGNPFLLQLMMATEQINSLPKGRVDLIEACLRMLLVQWKAEDALRADPNLGDEALVFGLKEKRLILRNIAWEMAKSGSDANSPEYTELFGLPKIPLNPFRLGNIMSSELLENTVKTSVSGFTERNTLVVARALIRHFRERNGIICYAGLDSYAFVHRAFLEFLTAECLQKLFEKGVLTQSDLAVFIRENCTREAWVEVHYQFFAMIGREHAENFLSEILTSGVENGVVLFTGKALKELNHKENSKLLLQNLKNRLIAISKCGPPDSHPFPGRAPGTSDEMYEDMKDDLNDQFQEQDYQTECEAVDALHLLGSLFSGVPDLVSHFQNLVNSSKSRLVQETAISVFAEGWKQDGNTHEWIVENARHGKSASIRKAALAALSHHWHTKSSLKILMDSACLEKEDPLVRKQAVASVAYGWQKDAKVISWLKLQVSENSNAEVCEMAVTAIADLYASDNKIRAWLKTVALSHPEESVRETTIVELTAHANEHPDVFNWLHKLVSAANNESIQATLVSVLGEHYPKHPDVYPLIVSLFEETKSSEVRASAITAVAGIRKTPEILALLKRSARSDHDPNVRYVSMNALVKHWKYDAETFEIIKSRTADESMAVMSRAYMLLEQAYGIWSKPM